MNKDKRYYYCIKRDQPELSYDMPMLKKIGEREERPGYIAIANGVLISSPVHPQSPLLHPHEITLFPVPPTGTWRMLSFIPVWYDRMVL